MFQPPTIKPSQLPGPARHALWLWAVSLLLSGITGAAQATIFSCSTGSGGVVFQDRPCAIYSTRDAPAPKKHKLPFDIHESWFELPGQAEGRAYCDRRRCECGELQRTLDGSLDRTVADALYMDGSWHRYKTSYQLWIDAPASSADTTELHRQMVEAACSVMISQQLLRKYADEVAARLRQKLLFAEEAGFDQPEPCQEEIRGACDSLDAVELFRRMQADARALRIPRDVGANAATLPLNR